MFVSYGNEQMEFMMGVERLRELGDEGVALFGGADRSLKELFKLVNGRQCRDGISVPVGARFPAPEKIADGETGQPGRRLRGPPGSQQRECVRIVVGQGRHRKGEAVEDPAHRQNVETAGGQLRQDAGLNQ
ncbi:hypothetical protein HD593_002017 [Nonomuraea rubra]|uniref:Uncharacterized protein n=1 Tax=Nonomuraea rubra TaxID=46180 RepID=A0A7X0NPK2_9ACTN|nr:hypothetical protein [Nonomuraea rubra]MBB6547222.1 hypothetical protein [Nonomuraea rubra]